MTLPNGDALALSTRGDTALRVRFLTAGGGDIAPIDSPMVSPEAPDAPFSACAPCGAIAGHGIVAASIGTLVVSAASELLLMDDNGKLLTRTEPLVGNATAGQLVFSSTATALLYGGGGRTSDPPSLTHSLVRASVQGCDVWAPHLYSTDGYAALGVVNITSGHGKTNELPIAYTKNETHLRWSRPLTSPFELYLMPAASLDEGTRRYYRLVGLPAVPPRFAFGFMASRWGWGDRTYIESVLHAFRDGAYPLDACALHPIQTPADAH